MPKSFVRVVSLTAKCACWFALATVVVAEASRLKEKARAPVALPAVPALAPAPVLPTPEAGDALIDEGVNLYSAGRYDEALGRFRRLRSEFTGVALSEDTAQSREMGYARGSSYAEIAGYYERLIERAKREAPARRFKDQGLLRKRMIDALNARDTAALAAVLWVEVEIGSCESHLGYQTPEQAARTLVRNLMDRSKVEALPRGAGRPDAFALSGFRSPVDIDTAAIFEVGLDGDSNGIAARTLTYCSPDTVAP